MYGNSIRKDVGSGKSTEERPGFHELVQDIKQGNIDVVIVYKLDRLSRKVGDIYDGDAESTIVEEDKVTIKHGR